MVSSQTLRRWMETESDILFDIASLRAFEIPLLFQGKEEEVAALKRRIQSRERDLDRLRQRKLNSMSNPPQKKDGCKQ